MKIWKIYIIDFFSDQFLSIFIRVISAFSVLLSSVIVSRLFVNKELSLYYLIIPVSTFFTMIFISPVSIFKLNRTIQNNTNIYKVIIEYIFFLFILAFLFSISLIFFLNNIDLKLRVLFSIYLFTEITIGTISGIIVQNESVHGKTSRSAKIGFIISISTIILPLIIGFLFTWNLESWIIGLITSRLVQIPIVAYVLNPFISHNNLKLKILIFIRDIYINWKSILKLSFNSILSWLHQNTSKFVISSYLGLNFSAPYLYVYSISATMASVLEGIFKPILDRNMFTSVNKIEKKIIKIDYIYILLGVIGFISLPIIGNIISKYRYEKYMNLSRFVFLFEISRLSMYYKLSLYQIKFGYNKTLSINIIFLFIYLALVYLFIYLSSSLFSFILLFVILFLVVLFLIRKIPSI